MSETLLNKSDDGSGRGRDLEAERRALFERKESQNAWLRELWEELGSGKPRPSPDEVLRERARSWGEERDLGDEGNAALAAVEWWLEGVCVVPLDAGSGGDALEPVGGLGVEDWLRYFSLNGLSRKQLTSWVEGWREEWVVGIVCGGPSDNVVVLRSDRDRREEPLRYAPCVPDGDDLLYFVRAEVEGTAAHELGILHGLGELVPVPPAPGKDWIRRFPGFPILNLPGELQPPEAVLLEQARAWGVEHGLADEDNTALLAVECWQLDLCVVPLEPGDGVPRPVAGLGLDDWLCDFSLNGLPLERLASWVEQWRPDWVVGVACGEPSGDAVVLRSEQVLDVEPLRYAPCLSDGRDRWYFTRAEVEGTVKHKYGTLYGLGELVPVPPAAGRNWLRSFQGFPVLDLPNELLPAPAIECGYDELAEEYDRAWAALDPEELAEVHGGDIPEAEGSPHESIYSIQSYDYHILEKEDLSTYGSKTISLSLGTIDHVGIQNGDVSAQPWFHAFKDYEVVSACERALGFVSTSNPGDHFECPLHPDHDPRPLATFTTDGKDSYAYRVHFPDGKRVSLTLPQLRAAIAYRTLVPLTTT